MKISLGKSSRKIGLESYKWGNDLDGLLLDEVRLSGEVLLPFQFLQTVAPPSTGGLEITSLDYEPDTGKATLVWN